MLGDNVGIELIKDSGARERESKKPRRITVNTWGIVYYRPNVRMRGRSGGGASRGGAY